MIGKLGLMVIIKWRVVEKPIAIFMIVKIIRMKWTSKYSN